MLRRSAFESFLIVASANKSQSLEGFAIETTGVREPEARMSQVSLSLFSTEKELPNRTRSKSPVSK